MQERQSAREAFEDAESDTGLWIVQAESESVAQFGVNSAGAEEHAEKLVAEQADLEAEIASTLGRNVTVAHTYTNVLNAIAVEADADEAAALWDVEGVTAVYPDTVRELDTDVSHEVIKSAAAWDGANAPEIATQGEGLIVAMIDSGVNPEHPSFAATGGDGYTHTNPNGAGTFLGACNTEVGIECNDKLIGAYTFNGPTARDTDGHGSHTGSTMAGNAHTAEFTLGTTDFEREVSGVAPHANVISYKVCNPGCPSSATIAAVDQAVADDVDVLNYSISGADNPWQDPVDLAFLDAHDAGISVSASGGNDGPGASTVAKTGPWNLSVAATTHKRVFGNPLSVTNDGAPAELVGIPGFPGDGPAITEVYTSDVADAETVSPGNGNGCAAFPAASMEGDIALIQRGGCNFADKVVNAQAAGAIAAVLYNNVSGPPTAPGGLETTTIPTVMITVESGQALRDYVAANDPTEVSIGTDVVLVEDDTWTDLVAGFSSRGPSQFDMLAPTVAAPGVNILAAYAESDGEPLQYGVISGTSMAAPHAAGMAALMREVYPDLTPTETRSVMATTADHEGLLKEDGSTPADAFDIGSGRINIDRAGRAGLALDETSANFVAANPAIGGEPSTLNLPAFVETACEGECSWTRTVTSIAQGPASYTAVVEAPAGVTVTVAPETFSLEPGAEQEVVVTANVSGGTVGAWAHGRVTLETSDQHADGIDIADPHFPVAVRTASTEVPADPPVIDVDPADLESSQPTDTVTTQTLTIGNTGGEDLTWEFGDGGGSASVELTHSASEDVVTGNSVGCSPDSGFSTTENSYLRQFVLADLGVTGHLEVASVTFGVEAMRPSGQTVGVNVYRMIDPEGSFIYANLEELGTTDYLVEPMELQLVTVPVVAEVPAGSTMVVEIAAPDLAGEAAFFIGSNGAGQTAPSYLASGTCGLPEPTNTADIGFPGMHIVMSVAGDVETVSECVVPGDLEWLSVDVTSGTTAPDGSTEVTASFDSTGLANGDYTADLCVESNDPANPVVTVPVTLTVADAPVITVDPTSLEGAQLPDEQTEHTLTVGNVGTADLEFTISEVETAAVADFGHPILPVGADRVHTTTDSGGVAAAPTVVEPAAVPTVASISEGFENVEALPAAGWAMTNNSEPVGITSWFQGNTAVFTAHEGADDAYVGANFNSAGLAPGHISNWLMTPELDLVNGSEFSFWTRSPAASVWADRLEVRLSTSGDSTDVGTGYEGVGDFDTLMLSVNPDLTPSGYPQEWTLYTATVEGLDAPTTGRVGMRYFVPNGGPEGTNSNYVGIDTLAYEAAEVPPTCEVSDAAWLTVTPTSGIVAAGGEQAVTVGLDSTGLAVGDHTADLCIESNDPAAPVTTVPVTLTVLAPAPVIEVDPVSVEVELESGDTGSSVVSVSNTGEADLEFDVVVAAAGGACAVVDAAWLTVTPTSGTVAPAGEQDLALAFDAAGLSAGDYTAELCIESNDGENPQVQVPVTLTVTDPPPVPVPVIVVDPVWVELELEAGDAGTSVVSVANTGDADLTFDVVEAAAGGSCEVADAAWLSVSPPSGTVAPAGEQDLELTFDATGLNAGEQLAELCIESNDPVDPTVQVPVTLTVTDAPVPPDPAQVIRIDGTDRYDTARLIAAEFPEGASTVFVANGEADLQGADALVSGAVAAGGPEVATDGPAPILLIKQDAVPLATWDALDDLDPERVVIIGGPVAVSEAVETELAATDVEVSRIAGDNRYETAVELSSDYATGGTVYVATGTGAPEAELALADALTSASVAGSQGAPVLLTQSDHLPTATTDRLTELAPAQIVLVGGPLAVTPEIEAELGAIAPTTRVFGDNRYETAVALSADYPTDTDRLYVASGTNFPDALVGAALTGSQDAPLLITRSDLLPMVIADEAERLSPQGITVFGGLIAINAEVQEALQAILDVTSID